MDDILGLGVGLGLEMMMGLVKVRLDMNEGLALELGQLSCTLCCPACFGPTPL